MQAGALSPTFIQLDGTNSYLSFADKLWYKAGATVEMTLHIAFTGWPAGTTTIFGKDAFGARLEISSAGIPSFVSIRSGGTTTVTGTTALERGKEYVLHGIDDGTSVKLYVNGVEAGTTGTAQTGLLTTDTNSWYVGRDVTDVVTINAKVYGFQLRLDGEIVGRWMPKTDSLSDADAAVVPDLSQYGNDAAITGTVATQYYFGSAWNDEPQWVGKATI